MRNELEYILKTKQDEPVLSFRVWFNKGGNVITGANILDASKLPKSLRTSTDETIDSDLQEWFANTKYQIPFPNTGFEQDEWILKQLKLKRTALSLGRLDVFLHYVQIRRHFLSMGQDELFYATPVEPFFWTAMMVTGWTHVFYQDVVKWEDISCI